jgi:LPXTG-motif cell wall-anchored protein
MVCRHVAAVLLVLVLSAVGACDAVAAIPSLSSTPPTTLGGPPPGLSNPGHRHHHPRSAPAHTTTSPSPVPTTTTTGALPMTGADLPLELGVAAGFVLIGLLALVAGRNRRYRYRRF